ncbi:MAG: TonB-dependent receptor [Chitinophagales bacterium]
MKKTLYYSLLWAFFVVYSSTVFAQNTYIRGTITDNETNEPLPRVQVFIKTWPSINTMSDAKGQYKIAMPPEHRTLEFKRDGYENHEVTIGVFGEIDVQLTSTENPMDLLSITSGRSLERTLDVPADISVVKSNVLKDIVAASPTDYLTGISGVDVMRTNLTTSNVVVRGFNNVFSGTTLTMVDNRIARIPSLYLNANQLLTFNLFDLDHIEVLKGPASALYGPNSSNGVIHFITSSPLDNKSKSSTMVSVGLGTRSQTANPIQEVSPQNQLIDNESRVVSIAGFRHSGKIEMNPSSSLEIGYKISGQYFGGNGWLYYDPTEPKTITKNRYNLNGKQIEGEVIDNTRNNEEENMFLDGRLDFRFNRDAQLTLAGGLSRFSGVEMTTVGATQVKDWTAGYAQAKLNWKDLFAQIYLNTSNAGDTYLFRNGSIISSQSTQYALQLQHSSTLSQNLQLLYGMDALLTRSNTDYTIHGQNEDSDAINEFGGFLQADLQLSQQLKFIGTLRTDKHNFIDNWFLSPRAALLFKPIENHTFRATYNKAFDSPSPLTLSLDITEFDDVYNFTSSLGLPSGTPLKALGNRGLNFSYGNNGLPQFRTPFASILGQDVATYFDLNDPTISNVIYGIALEGLLQGFQQGGLDPSLIALLRNQIIPSQVANIDHQIQTLTFEENFPFQPVETSQITDIQSLKNSVYQTFEVGYKGIVSDKLSVFGNVYLTHITDIISPLELLTPNVFLEPNSLSEYLGSQIFQKLQSPQYVSVATLLTQLLDQTDGSTFPIVGNQDGSGIDELVTLLTSSAASIPFGTISPIFENTPSMLFSYTNFGDVQLWGTELGFLYKLNDQWTAEGNYAYVSKGEFDADRGIPLALNAPQHKANFGLQYASNFGLDVAMKYRWQNAFSVNSGIYIGEVPSFGAVDIHLGYAFAPSRVTRLSLSIQNLLDNSHQEVVGAPTIGRFVALRLSHAFEEK